MQAFVGQGSKPLRNPASLAFKGRGLFITDFALFTMGRRDYPS